LNGTELYDWKENKLIKTTVSQNNEVRGTTGANKMGRLIESIDTLIKDWLSVEVMISVPCVTCHLRGGNVYKFPLQAGTT